MRLRGDTLYLNHTEFAKFRRVMQEAYFFADAPVEYAERTGEDPPVSFVIECVAKARLVYIRRLTDVFGKRITSLLASKRLSVKLDKCRSYSVQQKKFSKHT